MVVTHTTRTKLAANAATFSLHGGSSVAASLKEDAFEHNRLEHERQSLSWVSRIKEKGGGEVPVCNDLPGHRLSLYRSHLGQVNDCILNSVKIGAQPWCCRHTSTSKPLESTGLMLPLDASS